MIDIMVIISPYFGGYIGIFAIKKSIIDGNQWREIFFIMTILGAKKKIKGTKTPILGTLIYNNQ